MPEEIRGSSQAQNDEVLGAGVEHEGAFCRSQRTESSRAPYPISQSLPGRHLGSSASLCWL